MLSGMMLGNCSGLHLVCDSLKRLKSHGIWLARLLVVYRGDKERKGSGVGTPCACWSE